MSLGDHELLLAISPAALSAYARSAGWRAERQYRGHSVVYSRDSGPEILVPGTRDLGDYASVVATLLQTFAQVTGRESASIYLALRRSDQDIATVKLSRTGNDSDNSRNSRISLETCARSIKLKEYLSVVGGAHDLLLAAACSMESPRAVHVVDAGEERKLPIHIHVGPTRQDGFTMTLLTPAAPLPEWPRSGPNPRIGDAQQERRLMQRLLEALTAVRDAMRQPAAGKEDGFEKSVTSGASANLCDALVRIIGTFKTVDIEISWALTQPAATPGAVVQFRQADARVLREAAQRWRAAPCTG